MLSFKFVLIFKCRLEEKVLRYWVKHVGKNKPPAAEKVSVRKREKPGGLASLCRAWNSSQSFDGRSRWTLCKSWSNHFQAFGWTNIGTTNNFVKREIIVCDVCLYRPYRCIYLLIFVDFDYVLMVYFLFQWNLLKWPFYVKDLLIGLTAIRPLHRIWSVDHTWSTACLLTECQELCLDNTLPLFRSRKTQLGIFMGPPGEGRIFPTEPWN